MPVASATLRCAACSSALLLDDPPAAGDPLCPACAEWPPCDQCELPATNPHRTVDDADLCADCARDWTQCRECRLYTNLEHDTAEGNALCDGCARDCDTCADCLRYTRDYLRLDNDLIVCDDCSDGYSACRDCYILVSSSSDSYCLDCTYNHTHWRVHDYSYKPTPVFHGRGPLFLGLELEIRTPAEEYDRCVDLAADTVDGLAYLKDDGSIGSGCGFELVTHPMSYQWAIERFPWELLPELASQGAYVDDEVGIHVHVSRAAFASRAHVYRWLKFVYRNQSAATRLARRSSDEWASFTSDARAGIGDYAKGHHSRGLAGLGRFQAINTLPDDTFEVRIFASSLLPQQVQAALAFVAASVDYTRTLTVSGIARHRGWEWTAFVTWLRSRPKFLPLLAELEDLACAS
ncbi:hypothetical protein NDR87_13610 [Nocardia sp. CDC159]|uniref:Amidoligase enzyme n=1 Tax=Nocardia pulmonis TaxID=2951408 RepID=A0A9X2E5D0_9NOCA|nr:MULTISPECIES: hypothetical protein [Nocardia]MCM6774539.1 hypothetical protein [Nocardia pulmonis]MCM6787395.1 hypothetical protein [Nocardia sp. CDC159]